MAAKQILFINIREVEVGRGALSADRLKLSRADNCTEPLYDRQFLDTTSTTVSDYLDSL